MYNIVYLHILYGWWLVESFGLMSTAEVFQVLFIELIILFGYQHKLCQDENRFYYVCICVLCIVIYIHILYIYII